MDPIEGAQLIDAGQGTTLGTFDSIGCLRAGGVPMNASLAVDPTTGSMTLQDPLGTTIGTVGASGEVFDVAGHPTGLKVSSGTWLDRMRANPYASDGAPSSIQDIVSSPLKDLI